MKKIELAHLKIWYSKNLEKLLFLFLVLVFFTLTTTYIPFLNVFATPSAGFGIFIVVWYLLFSPTTKFLAGTAIASLFFGFISTFLEVDVLLEAVSQFLLLLLIFILINYIKKESRE